MCYYVHTCFICFTYYRSNAAAPALAAALAAPAAALPAAAACEDAIPACVPSPSLPFYLDLFTGVEIRRMVMGSTFYFFCSERGFLHKKIIKNRPASEHKNWQISFVQSKYEQHTDVFPLRSLLDIIMDTDMRAQAPRTLSDPYIHRWSRRKGASNCRVCGHVHKRIFYREDRTHKFDHCCLFKDLRVASLFLLQLLVRVSVWGN